MGKKFLFFIFYFLGNYYFMFFFFLTFIHYVSGVLMDINTVDCYQMKICTCIICDKG